MILNIATTNLQTDGTTEPTLVPALYLEKIEIEWRFKFPVSIESVTIDLADQLNDLNPTGMYNIKCYYRLEEGELNLPQAIRFDDIENTQLDYTDITEFLINSGGIAKLIPKNNIPFSCKVFGFSVEATEQPIPY